jgi:hypothetical protein
MTTTSVVKQVLQHIYSNIWVECVIRSPLYRPGELIVGGGEETGSNANGGKGGNIISGQGTFDIRSTNFERKLDAYLASQAWFR